MKLRYEIKGEPIGKARPRVTRGGRVTYTPKKTKDYEAQVRFLARREYELKVREVTKAIDDVLEGPIKVTITAVFGVPKSYSKKRREACLSGKEYPMKKPDIDNIEKIVLDGLNPVMKTNKATHHKEMLQKGLYKDDK